MHGQSATGQVATSSIPRRQGAAAADDPPFTHPGRTAAIAAIIATAWIAPPYQWIGGAQPNAPRVLQTIDGPVVVADTVLRRPENQGNWWQQEARAQQPRTMLVQPAAVPFSPKSQTQWSTGWTSQQPRQLVVQPAAAETFVPFTRDQRSQWSSGWAAQQPRQLVVQPGAVVVVDYPFVRTPQQSQWPTGWISPQRQNFLVQPFFVPFMRPSQQSQWRTDWPSQQRRQYIVQQPAPVTFVPFTRQPLSTAWLAPTYQLQPRRFLVQPFVAPPADQPPPFSRRWLSTISERWSKEGLWKWQRGPYHVRLEPSVVRDSPSPWRTVFVKRDTRTNAVQADKPRATAVAADVRFVIVQAEDRVVVVEEDTRTVFYQGAQSS